MIDFRFPKFIIQRLEKQRTKPRQSNPLTSPSFAQNLSIGEILSKNALVLSNYNFPNKFVFLILVNFLTTIYLKSKATLKIKKALAYFVHEADAINDNQSSNLGFVDDFFLLLLAYKSMNENQNDDFGIFNPEINTISLEDNFFSIMLDRNFESDCFDNVKENFDSILQSYSLKFNILKTSFGKGNISTSDLLENLYSTLGFRTPPYSVSPERWISCLFLSGFEDLDFFNSVANLNLFIKAIKECTEYKKNKINILVWNLSSKEKQTFIAGLLFGILILEIEDHNLRLDDAKLEDFLRNNELGIYKFDLDSLSFHREIPFFENDEIRFPDSRFPIKNFKEIFIKKNIFETPRATSIMKIAANNSSKIFNDYNFINFLNVFIPEYSNPIISPFHVSAEINDSSIWKFIKKFLFREYEYSVTRIFSTKNQNFENPGNYLGIENLIAIRDLNLKNPENRINIYEVRDQVSYRNSYFQSILDELIFLVEDPDIDNLKNKNQLRYFIFVDGRWSMEIQNKFGLNSLFSIKKFGEIEDIQIETIDIPSSFSGIDQIVSRLLTANHEELKLSESLKRFRYDFLYSCKSKQDFDLLLQALDNIPGVEDILYFQKFFDDDGARNKILGSLVYAIKKELEVGHRIRIVCTAAAKAVIIEEFEKSENFQIDENLFSRDKIHTLGSILNSRKSFYTDFDTIIVFNNFSRKLEYLLTLKVKKIIRIQFSDQYLEDDTEDIDDKKESFIEITHIGGLSFKNYFSDGRVLTRERGDENIKVKIKPIKDVKENISKYLGVWITDDDEWNVDKFLDNNFDYVDRKTNTKALIWKRDLKIYFIEKCNEDLVKLSRDLANVGLVRGPLTLLEWLNGNTTLLPKGGIKDLKRLYQCLCKKFPYTDKEAAELRNLQMKKLILLREIRTFLSSKSNIIREQSTVERIAKKLTFNEFPEGNK